MMEDFFCVGENYIPIAATMASPKNQPPATTEQQQQSNTTTTMPMIKPVMFFLGSSEGVTGISDMMISPYTKMGWSNFVHYKRNQAVCDF